MKFSMINKYIYSAERLMSSVDRILTLTARYESRSYQIGEEFSSKSNEIVFKAVSLVSFMQIRLKKTFL